MYKLENFTNNGVAYPFDLIDNNLNKENLLNEYLNFQKQANIYLKEDYIKTKSSIKILIIVF